MKKNIYLSFFVFLTALAVAWWSVDRSDSKSLPKRSAGRELRKSATGVQPPNCLNDAKDSLGGGRDLKMSRQSKVDFTGKTQQVAAQIKSVAEFQPSSSSGEMQDADKFPVYGSDFSDESEDQPQAVRLADDFELPAIVMHMAAIGAGHDRALPVTPKIKAAVDHLVENFYSDVAQLSGDVVQGDEIANGESNNESTAQDQSELITDPESSDVTHVIAPTEETMQAVEKVNRSHQLLFGDEAANRYGIQSKLEVSLPVEQTQ